MAVRAAPGVCRGSGPIIGGSPGVSAARVASGGSIVSSGTLGVGACIVAVIVVAGCIVSEGVAVGVGRPETLDVTVAARVARKGRVGSTTVGTSIVGTMTVGITTVGTAAVGCFPGGRAVACSVSLGSRVRVRLGRGVADGSTTGGDVGLALGTTIGSCVG